MLKDCIAPKFADTKQMKELFLIEEKELERIYRRNEKLYEELFISLADENIERYEKEYALKEDALLTLNQKRARILAKKNSRIVPKISNFSTVIKNLVGAEDVIIKEGTNELSVYVKTAELVENMQIAKDFLRDVRPAHLGYDFINNLNRSSFCIINFGIKAFRKKSIKVVV